MAVTVTFTEDTNGRQRVGRQHVVSGRISLSGTYETGGFTVNKDTFGLQALESLQVANFWNGTEMMVAVWDSANSKVKLGWTGGATSSELDEITNSDNVGSFVGDITAKGR